MVSDCVIDVRNDLINYVKKKNLLSIPQQK